MSFIIHYLSAQAQQTERAALSFQCAKSNWLPIDAHQVGTS